MSESSFSRFERSRKLAGTGLKMGVNYAKENLKNRFKSERKKRPLSEIHRENATTLFKTLSTLRGTALKAAQGLSMDSAIMPEEYAQVLAQAQYQVPPIDSSLVNAIVKQELGASPSEVFERFEPKAKAAASLGQVHYATMKDGTEVAVKIQYPNVRESIDSDLAVMKTVARQMVKTSKFEEYFAEVREKLLEETDYLHEGQQMQAFNQAFENVEWLEMPRWIPSLSTKKVLVMSRLNGKHLKEFMVEADAEKRNRYGQYLWDFFHIQIDDRYMLHADTHPGNFMFTDSGKLGVLDYGCIKHFPKAFYDDYMLLMPLHVEKDDQAIWRLYERLEMVDSKAKNQQEERRFFAFCKDFGSMFIEPYRQECFDFSHSEYQERLNRYVREISQFGEPRGSRHFIYTAKSHFGLFSLLFQLGAKVNTSFGLRQVQRFLSSVGEEREARILDVLGSEA